MPTSLSTVTAAKLFVAIGTLTSPTVSNIPDMLEQPTRPVERLTSLAPSVLVASPLLVTTSVNDDIFEYDKLQRQTTVAEKIVGELRQWGLLQADWDGEGASAPSAQSIKEAVSFVKLLGNVAAPPEPMLLASGHAALYWNIDNLYADIEFLGDGRIGYFIKRNGDKHKGVFAFNQQEMPAVLQALIWA